MKLQTKIPQNTQFEQEKENEQRLRTCGTITKDSKCVSSISDKKESVRQTAGVTAGPNSTYLLKNKVQLNKPQTKLNPKKSMLRHIIIKLPKKTDREKS